MAGHLHVGPITTTGSFDAASGQRASDSAHTGDRRRSGISRPFDGASAGVA
jgi:hypothetical protein